MRFLRFLMVFAFVGLLAVPPAANADAPSRTLFVGVSGVEAARVSPEVLAALEEAGAAVTNLHTRTASPLTCPADGWMSMRLAGTAVDWVGRAEGGCRPSLEVLTDGGAGVVQGFEEVTASVQWPSEPGEGVAIGEGAALMLADARGVAPNWVSAPSDAQALGEVVSQALEQTSGNVIVDAGWVLADASSANSSAQVEASLAGVNERLAAVIRAYASHVEAEPGTRLIVASLGDSSPTPALQFGAVAGAGSGLLYSSSTRSAGLATLGDLRALLTGTEISIEEASLPEAMQELTDNATHASAARKSLTPFFAVWGAFLGIGLLAGLLHFLHRPGREQGPAKVWRNISVWNSAAFAFVPAAMILNLLPWWRWSPGPLLPIALTAALAAALWLLARTSAHPISVLAALTLLLVSVDIVSGAHLQRDGFFGSMTLASRRFYGVSNRSYVILLASGLLATLPWIADRMPKRREAATGVAAMGFGVLLIDALPFWGADFGGPAGIIAGFGVAYLMVRGERPRWVHAAAWVGLTAATMLVAGLLDARSNTPSHIGLFWRGFGKEESWTLIGEKLSDMLATFAGSPLILAGAVAGIALVAWLVMYSRRLLAQGEPPLGPQQNPQIAPQGKPQGELQGDPQLDPEQSPESPSQCPSEPTTALSPHREALADASTPGIKAVAAGIAVGALIAIPINDSGLLIAVDTLAFAGPALVAILARQIQTARTRCTGSRESGEARLEA
ncbi:MAG: hypothetical protein Q4E01_05460 [Actinomycetaceae bacterium]|nr:hypothetical protein [Actinomycetaceae bacterium]